MQELLENKNLSLEVSVKERTRIYSWLEVTLTAITDFETTFSVSLDLTYFVLSQIITDNRHPMTVEVDSELPTRKHKTTTKTLEI